MQTIALNKPGAFSYNILFPAAWDELTKEELEAVALAQLGVYETEYMSKAIVFISLLSIRANAQAVTLPGGWKENLNIEDAATQGFDSIDFLYTDNTRTINPYPELIVGKKRMIGPADDFNEILCGEMEDCEVFFTQFSEAPDLQLLASIAAVLWRPRNAPYQTKASESRKEIFKSLLPEQLFSIYIWYTGCRNQLPKIFPLVYGGGESTGEADPASFTKCIHAGAGPKNGTRNNIRIMPAKEFLFDMQLEAEHAEALKEQYERS